MTAPHTHQTTPDLESYLEPEEKGMNPAWLLVVLAVMAGVVFILVDGSKSETYFYEVDKAVAQGPDVVGKTIRIKGKVEVGSVTGKDGELSRTFNLIENGKVMRVSYNKALPDTFKEDMEVVAQGKVDKDYTLLADEVIVKCPSRYEEKAPTTNASKPGPTIQ